MNPDILIVAVGIVVMYGTTLFFRDRDKQRLHENKLSVEILAKAAEQNQAVKDQIAVLVNLDEHVRTNLTNYKTAMVEVLKDMREIVKSTESERKRTAGVAAGTLLHPGKRLPQP